MKKCDKPVERNHNRNWPCIPDHPYRILIIGGSGSDKTNDFLVEAKSYLWKWMNYGLVVNNPSGKSFFLVVIPTPLIQCTDAEYREELK